MKRRTFIAGLGSAAAWPVLARAQQPPPVIGFLYYQSPALFADLGHAAAFHRGLAETGYIEGKNVSIGYHWGEGQHDRVVALAGEMVRNRYAVIVVFGSTPGALALKAATQTIPIVFQIGTDPVAAGLVASVNHPSGNLTGVSVMNVEISAKLIELLHEFLPTAKSVAFLVNPTNADQTEAEVKELQSAAGLFGLRLLVLNASTPNEIEAAFATAFPEQADALVVSGDSFFSTYRDRVVALAARYRVPAVGATSAFAADGGLMSYGAGLLDRIGAWRIVGVYTGRILKGEKPADLPVQLPTRIELHLNMRTAKALGLTVPQSILLRADEVIE
jgi:putative tryptophan/tyrosine transport system substrate-binding protein